MIKLLLSMISSLALAAPTNELQANKIILKDPASIYKISLIPPGLTANYTFKYPVDAGIAGSVLSTDGSGNLSWNQGISTPNSNVSADSILFLAGNTSDTTGTYDGGSVNLFAGSTSSTGAVGGDITLAAGFGDVNMGKVRVVTRTSSVSFSGNELNLYDSEIASTAPVFSLSALSGSLSFIGTSATFNGLAVHGVLDPTTAQDAATKNYVDVAVGSAGGGGGGANWRAKLGLGPLADVENDELVYLFGVGNLEEIELFYKVPSTYQAGTQINLTASFYSPSSSNVFRFQLVSTLVRTGTDAVTSVTNQNTVNSGDLTNAVANRLRTSTLALTSAGGLINSVGVSANDLIKLELTRVTPAGTDDTADIRFIPSMTGIK